MSETNQDKVIMKELGVERMPTVLAAHDRITASLQVNHEQRGDDPTQVDCRFSALLESNTEEAYSRKITVPPGWDELDLGWMRGQRISMIVLVNREGQKQLTKPTEEQKADLVRQVLEVGMYSGVGIRSFAIIKPGRFIAFEPLDALRIQVRSTHQPIKAIVHVIPG